MNVYDLSDHIRHLIHPDNDQHKPFKRNEARVGSPAGEPSDGDGQQGNRPRRPAGSPDQDQDGRQGLGRHADRGDQPGQDLDGQQQQDQDQDLSPAGDPPGAGSPGRVGTAGGDQNQSPPPDGITGGTLQVTSGDRSIPVKIDWLNAVGPSLLVPELLQLLLPDLGEPELQEYGMHTYKQMYTWRGGAKLMFSDGRPDCLLSFNGDAWDLFPLAQQLALVKRLHTAGFHLTRVDLAADFPRDFLLMAEVRQAVAEADVCGFRRVKDHGEQEIRGGRLFRTSDGIDFGRKGKDGSGVAYTIYDKFLESDGEIDANRIEAKFSKDRAALVGQMLAKCEDLQALALLIAKLVASHIDFRDHDPNGHHEAHVPLRPRLSWWQQIIDVLTTCAKVIVPRTVPPLQRAVRACKRQYLETLAAAKVVCESKGHDFAGILLAAIDRAVDAINWNRMSRRDLDLNLRQALT